MFRTVGAFATGVVAGWVARGAAGSERELLLRTIGVAQRINDEVRRAAAEQLEWWQDLLAEARARAEADTEGAKPDEDSHAQVIRVV